MYLINENFSPIFPRLEFRSSKHFAASYSCRQSAVKRRSSFRVLLPDTDRQINLQPAVPVTDSALSEMSEDLMRLCLS